MAGGWVHVKVKQDQETVRRLLESALLRLNGETNNGDEGSNSIVVSESDGHGSALIVMLVEGLGSSAQDERRIETGQLAMANPPASTRSEGQASHPGLERFLLTTTDPHPPATKACFMEPGRACCSSGACEMRGF
jgi:hypothetical protein